MSTPAALSHPVSEAVVLTQSVRVNITSTSLLERSERWRAPQAIIFQVRIKANLMECVDDVYRYHAWEKKVVSQERSRHDERMCLW